MGKIPKYFLKDGRTIRQYYKDVKVDIPFGTIMYRIIKLGWDPDVAVTKPSQQLRMVHGKPLKIFCREHNLPYEHIHVSWKNLTERNKIRRKPDISIEQFVDDWIAGKTYEDVGKETYGIHYCKSKGLNYESTYTYWRNYKRDKYTFKEYVDFKAAKKGATDLEHLDGTAYCRLKGYDIYHIRNLYYRKKKQHGCKTFKDFIRKWEQDNGKGGETS